MGIIWQGFQSKMEVMGTLALMKIQCLQFCSVYVYTRIPITPKKQLISVVIFLCNLCPVNS